MKCKRYKKVRVKGQGVAKRCAKFGAGRPRSKSAKRKTGYRRGHKPFNKGRRCQQMGVNKRGVATCVSYGGKPSKRAKGRLIGPRAPSMRERLAASAWGQRVGFQGLRRVR